MISFEEAISMVLNDSGQIPGEEKVYFTDTPKRILARDVISDTDMPPFDKSAMDGYACRKQDILNELDVIEVIPAGTFPTKKISKNQCSKIMTGARLPQDADCVLMVEHTEKTGENKIRFTKTETAANICYRGDDVRKGDIVLPKGMLIQPQHIAVMAMAGCTHPVVSPKVKVGILSTGNEIVEPPFLPGPSQIRNSNAYQLIAQVINAGAKPDYYGIADDTEDATLQAVSILSERNDMVLITGGVSMGDFDFVPEVIKKAGFDILFRTVAVQPGKPTLFARKKEKHCFGLPGNPVSAFFQFELLVKPLIYKMMGHHYQPLTISMPMGENYHRKKSERRAFIPVLIKNGAVFPVSYHGSAHIASLTEAQGILSIAIGTTELKKGEIVDVRPF